MTGRWQDAWIDLEMRIVPPDRAKSALPHLAEVIEVKQALDERRDDVKVYVWDGAPGGVFTRAIVCQRRKSGDTLDVGIHVRSSLYILLAPLARWSMTCLIQSIDRIADIKATLVQFARSGAFRFR